MTAALVAVPLVPATPAIDPSVGEPRAGVAANLLPFLADDVDRVGVIIQFASDPTDDDMDRLLDAGFLPGMVRYRIVPAVYAEGSADAVKAILDDPRVTHVEHDAAYAFTLDRAKAVGRAEATWTAEWKDDLGVVHTGGFTGRGVGVAVVDSGIDATHPDLIWGPAAEAAGLAPKTIANFKMVGRDSIGLTGLVPGVDPVVEANMLAIDMAHTDNTGGHGTHVAGSVAATGAASDGKYQGAAPGANLIGYGAGEVLLVHLGLAAFDHIHQHHGDLGVRIVTNSWGGAGDWNPDSVITKAVQRLVNEDGLVVLFAAGNDGGDGSTIQTSVWANIPEAISVANYYDGAGFVDSSSSRGRLDLGRTWPDLAAPGTQIISTAATGGPVSYYGSAQDALIDELESDQEPTVVPAPVPATAGTGVDGEEVVVGPYGSMTGTSMATPFVAGVAALILEANPDLTPFQVREILRETANMPDGRHYVTDGFAIGKGVVDAAEAVAVALKMKDGTSLHEALKTAHADVDVSPARLNFATSRHLVIDQDVIDDDSLTVNGTLHAGAVTNNSVPLLPPPGPAVSGDPHIYQGGVVDPFLVGTPTVAPGEPVGLSVRNIQSDGSVSLDGATATHTILQDGVVTYGPFAAAVGSDTTGIRSDSDWTVPADAIGAYEFVATVTVASVTYEAARLPFNVGPGDADVGGTSTQASPLALPGGTPYGATTTVLSEGFETGGSGWTVEQNGLGSGLLTEWHLLGDSLTGLSWAGSHSGEQWFHASVVVDGPAEVSGLYYTDLADTTLVSPVLDLGSLASAELSYWRAGCSEGGFDFLEVYVEPVGGSPVLLERVSDGLFTSGNAACGGWAEASFDISSFVGQDVRLRYRFVSDIVSGDVNVGGWGIDDVALTGTAGTPSVVIVPDLAADRLFGIEELTTTFRFSASASEDIVEYRLDFDDGSPVHVNTTAAGGDVAHTYAAPGQYVATLTVETVSGATATATLLMDVAPTGEVQVRIGGGAWTDAGATDGSTDAAFGATLDIGHLAPGDYLLEARHFDANGHEIRDVRTVTIP